MRLPSPMLARSGPNPSGRVRKRRGQRYRPGERAWIKTKNRDYWRYEQELESLRRSLVCCQALGQSIQKEVGDAEDRRRPRSARREGMAY